MHRQLLDYLLSGHHFSKDEKLLAYQFKFFNIMLTLAFSFSPFIAYLHRDFDIILVYSDNAFAISSFILFLFLRRDRNNFRLASQLFVPSLFITITLVFFLAGDDPTKVIWAPIFFACAFLLLSTWQGMAWLGAILGSYFLGYFLLGEEKIFYTLEELLLISIAFVTVSFIFSAFKQKNESDNTSLLTANARLKEKSNELEDFNQNLEKRIEQALLESQHKTKAIQRNLDIINQHVITAHIDLNGLITNVSEAFCLLSQYKRQHFISKPFTLLFDSKTHIQDLKEIWKLLQEEKVYTSEVRNLNKRLQSYWLDMTISPEYTAQDELIGYIMIAHNITDKKLVLQQQEQLISQSRHAAMGEMISMIAHQWRQPLATISTIVTSMNIDINLESSTPDKIQEQLERINIQVQHLSSTVDDFRDFFKPTKGLENTYVNTLVEEAIKLLDHRLNSHIQLVFKNRIETCLALYRNELVQVLINILNNACDAIEETKPARPMISIDEYIEDQDVIIEIADNAGGIKEETLMHIFDPYFSTKTKNGTGLGLYMSKTIVEDHQKGKLSAYNQGAGVVFKIALPLASCNI